MRFKVECGIKQNSKEFNRWVRRTINKFNRRNKIVVSRYIVVIEINVNYRRIEIEVVVGNIADLCDANLTSCQTFTSYGNTHGFLK
jgi:hypothetical protein